jgi:tetratricopeptide (TPR) repeat protein
VKDFGIGRWHRKFGRGLACAAVALGMVMAGPAEVSGRQADSRRIALVVTNNSAGPDIAAGGDVMSRKLTALGYSVVSASNAGQRDFDRAIGQLEGQVDGSTIVAIYYAGFGVRANGRDYLVPAGVTPTSAAGLPASAIDLDDTVQRLRAKGAMVTIFLDACPSSMMLNALGGVCAGDPGRRTPDVYLISSAARMRPGDLTSQLPGLLKGGRTVAQTFNDLETTFASIAVVQIPTPPSPRAGSVTFGVGAPVAPAPVAPAPAPPPSPVQPVAAAQPPAPAPLSSDGVPMVEYLTDLLDLTDAGEAQRARAKASEFDARYLRDLAGADDRARYTVEATLAYVNGNYDRALAAIEAARAAETAQGLPPLTANPERRRNRLEGSIYLRLGRIPLAIARLEAEEKSYIGFTDNASKSGPVWTRLGEAYRLAGRRSEAREMLKNAERVQSRGGKGLAYLQLSLLSYDEGAYQDAADTANTAIQILKGPPPLSGLADAYIAFAKARFKLRSRDEGEAWRYLDLAREIDRGSAAANAFEAELPARLVDPPFASMRPTFSFSRDIERRALTCYDTPEARDAYLATITAESAAASAYLGRIDAYMKTLNRLLADYEARGYLEDYEGSVRGRGYRFRTQILAEQAAWTGRWTEIEGRIASLATWFGVAARADVPCKDGPGSWLNPPAGYQPKMPREDFTGAAISAPAPRTAAATPAFSQPPMASQSSQPPHPAPITTPPVVAAPAPPPARVVTAPPPVASPVVTAPPPQPKPVALAAASPPPPTVSAPPPTATTTRPALPPPPPAVATPTPPPRTTTPVAPPSRPAQTAAAPSPPAVTTTASPPAGGFPQPGTDKTPARPVLNPPTTTVASAPPPKVVPRHPPRSPSRRSGPPPRLWPLQQRFPRPPRQPRPAGSSSRLLSCWRSRLRRPLPRRRRRWRLLSERVRRRQGQRRPRPPVLPPRGPPSIAPRPR